MRNEIWKTSLLFLSIMVGFGMLISAQPNDEQKVRLDQVKVPLSKPGQPVFVQVSNREGNIKVMGTDGQEVIVETYGRKEDSSRGARESGRKSEGLRLIRSASSSLEIEEENNKVRIEPGSGMEGLDLVIKVPRQCSLNLSSSDGDIVVENVSGDLEVESTDGDVVLKGISGSVVASSADGDVTVVLNAVTPGKPMSFSTVDGDVDVTLPSDIKATVKLKTVEGDIYTDFAVNLQPTLNKKEEKRGNVYRLELDRIMTGTINGGGPEYKFYSLEGDIYLRQKK
jgi:DUF4097 and DUF4098 domain-containing protein YvlB